MISGASFAGLALARGLTQALGPDLRIALIDHDANLSPAADDGRAFAIWAGGQAVLESLGVWETIAPHAETLTAIEISDSALDDGVRQTRVTYDAQTSGGKPACHIVPSFVLQNALMDALSPWGEGASSKSSITWFAPAEAAHFSLGDVLAEVHLSDGRVLASSLVVAAEGRHSKLRDAAGIKTMGWSYEQTGIVATVAFELPHGGIAIQHFLPGGPFAILPLRGNKACITWSAAQKDAERIIALNDAAFLAELDERIGGRFGTLALAGPRRSWPLDLKLARDLTAKRFAVIGDAAHGVHPVAGQGVNLALRDVAALVECVTDAARLGFDPGHGAALEKYARWRRFDSTMSASLYEGINRVFSIDNTVMRAGRGAAMGILDTLPALKTMIIDEAAGVTGDLPKMLKGEGV